MKELYKPFQPILTESGLKRFDLILEHSPPCSLLRGTVHSFLQVSAAKPTPYPVIPDGTQAVFISSRGTQIGGAQLLARDIQMPQQGDYFGIRFHPGALRYFFDLNLLEITDQIVDSQYIPCEKFNELHDHIYQCQSFNGRIHICEQWLLQYYKPRPITQLDHALSLIHQSSGNIKISQLAEMVGCSSRHLNRLFSFHTGLSTKTFAQIIRLQYVCRRIYITRSSSTNTALELGFFDQPHLLKDFKKYLSSSPSQFFDRFMSDFYNS